MVNYGATTDPLSGLTEGRPELLNGQAAWNDLFKAHDITSTTALDALFCQLYNSSAADVDVAMVVQPDDETVEANVDLATITISVPLKSFVVVRDGQRLRRRASGTRTYVLAFYLPGGAGDDDKISVDGWFVRREQDAVTP